MLADYLGQLDFDEAAERYREHVEAIPVRSTHEGYFSIDKKTGRSSTARSLRAATSRASPTTSTPTT